MSLRELVDVPFGLIQANGKRFWGFAVSTFLVAEILALAIVWLVVHFGDGGGWAVTGAVLGTLLVAWAARLFVAGAVTATCVGSVFGGSKGMAGRVGALLAAGVVRTVLALLTLVGASIVAVVFPPLYLALGGMRTRWSLVLPVVFAEKASQATAFGRSSLLTRQVSWRQGRVWLAHRLVMVAALLPLGGLTLLVSVISGTQQWPAIGLGVAAFMVLAIFSELVESAARVVTYVDLRCRREAFDLRVPGYPVVAA